MSRALGLLLVIVSALFNAAWTHGGGPRSPAAVTCNITTGTCSGTAPFTFTAATCDGNPAHNDSAAFASFNSAALTWQGTNTGLIELDLPHGAVCEFTGNGLGIAFANGIKQFRMVGLGYSGNGDGATLSDGKTGIGTGGGNGWFLGALHGVIQDNAHSARLASVNIGDTCVTLLDATKASLFTASNYVLISGFDMQQGGFPPNPYYYEYPQIASVDAAHKCDGTAGASVTFTAAVANKYLSTWPVYNVGSVTEVDQGGPATLYALDSAWNITATYIGITFDMPDFNTYSKGLSVAFQNVKFTGALCATPTENWVYTITNADMTSCDMEVDKIIGTITLSGVTINQLNFQSSSVNQFTLTNNSTVVSSQQGTPKKFTCSGSTISSFQVGAHAYGRTSEVDIGNCGVTGMAVTAVSDRGNGNGLGGTSNPGFNFTREMSAGVIKVANAVLITNAVNNGSGFWRITVSCQSIFPSCIDATAGFTVGQFYELSLVCMSDNPGCGIPGDKAGNFKVTAKSSVAHTIDLDFAFGAYTYTSGGQIAGAQLTWDVPGTNMIWGGQFAEESLSWQVQTVTQDGNFTYVQTSLAGGLPTIPTYTSSAGAAIFASVHPAPKFSCNGCSGDVNAIAFGLDPSHGPYGSYWKRTFVDGTSTPVVPVFGNVSLIDTNVTASFGGAGSLNFNLNGPFIVNSSGTTSIYNPLVNAKTVGDRNVTLSGSTCASGTCTGDSGMTLPDATLTFLVDNQITAEYSGSITGSPVSTTLTIQTDQGVVYPPVVP